MQTLAHVALIGSVILLAFRRGAWIPGLLIAVCYADAYL
jgi:hypothetical protein